MKPKAINNKKAQMNLEFIISVILLTVITISAAIAILRLLPAFGTAATEINLRARATDLARILFEEPGFPKNWTSDPVIIGLAYFNNYSNETVRGVLDPIKVNFVNNSIVYSQLKKNLSLDEDINFQLIMRNSTGVIMNYYNYTPGRTDVTVIIKKFVAINNTQANITLLVWQ